MTRTKKGSEEYIDMDEHQEIDASEEPENLETTSFEQSLEELESLVEKLERGQLTLDESLELFERGMKLARICNRELSTAERKIEILIEDNGNLKTESFVDE